MQAAEGRSVLDRGLVLDEHRESLAVSVLDGVPGVILKMPSPTYLPLLFTLCLSAGFAGLISHIWAISYAALGLGALVVFAWLWPRAEVGQREGLHG